MYRTLIPVFNSQQHEVGMRGKILRMSPKEGIGFIMTRDGEEVPFNRLGLAGYDFKDFQIGDMVEFELEEASKGSRAVRIRMSM